MKELQFEKKIQHFVYFWGILPTFSLVEGIRAPNLVMFTKHRTTWSADQSDRRIHTHPQHTSRKIFLPNRHKFSKHEPTNIPYPGQPGQKQL